MIDKSIQSLTRSATPAGAAVASSLRRVIRNVSMRVIRERQLSDYRERRGPIRAEIDPFPFRPAPLFLAITKIRGITRGRPLCPTIGR